MPTHDNAYELVSQVRDGLNENSPAYVQGQDTTGGYKNAAILKAINDSIRELYALMVKRIPNEFLEEAPVTPVNSVVTLPANFSKLVLFRDENGGQVFDINQNERRGANDAGSRRCYYRKGNTLVLDKAGVSTPHSLIYLRKPREVHHGVLKGAAAGPPPTITLDADAKRIEDYYNGMLIEVVQGDYVDTVSDYTSGRVASVGAGGVQGHWYGMVPDIPDWGHALIAPRAVIKLKTRPQSPEKPSRQEMDDYKEMFRSIFLAHCAPSGDQDWEGLFTSFEPKTHGIIGL